MHTSISVTLIGIGLTMLVLAETVFSRKVTSPKLISRMNAIGTLLCISGMMFMIVTN